MVATVLTVYGIETELRRHSPCQHKMRCNSTYRLRYWNTQPENIVLRLALVATVLTVYGIETMRNTEPSASSIPVATVLTVYGIETIVCEIILYKINYIVATVLTVYGIETRASSPLYCTLVLQQYLPFTVLKRTFITISDTTYRSCNSTYRLRYWNKINWRIKQKAS